MRDLERLALRLGNDLSSVTSRTRSATSRPNSLSISAAAMPWSSIASCRKAAHLAVGLGQAGALGTQPLGDLVVHHPVGLDGGAVVVDLDAADRGELMTAGADASRSARLAAPADGR
jgi:hypothetical protein